MYMYMYIYVCVCMHVYVCTHTYIWYFIRLFVFTIFHKQNKYIVSSNIIRNFGFFLNKLHVQHVHIDWLVFIHCSYFTVTTISWIVIYIHTAIFAYIPYVQHWSTWNVL